MSKVAKPAGCAAGVVGLLFASSMLTIIIAIAIWPGEAKLTAFLLCPDDKPEAFVVSDTTSVRPGETSTNFTLYCVGDSGAFEEIGWFVPMGLLWIFHTLVILVVIALFIGRSRLKRSRTALGGAGPPPEPAGPLL